MMPERMPTGTLSLASSFAVRGGATSRLADGSARAARDQHLRALGRDQEARPAPRGPRRRGSRARGRPRRRRRTAGPGWRRSRRRRRRANGDVEQVGLAEAQQQAGDRQHRDRQHQRAAELLQSRRGSLHVALRSRARGRARAPRAADAERRGARSASAAASRAACGSRTHGRLSAGIAAGTTDSSCTPEADQERQRRPGRRPGRRRHRPALAARSRGRGGRARSAAAPPGCSASSRAASSGWPRSMASVYCVRSLVPIERKSASAASRSASSGRGGRLDHHAERRARRHAQLRRRSSSISARTARSSPSVGDHRQQDAALRPARTAQDRAQLRRAAAPGCRRLGAHAAQAERRDCLRAAAAGRAAACRRRRRACGSSSGRPPSASRRAGSPRLLVLRRRLARSRNRNSVRSRPQPSAPARPRCAPRRAEPRLAYTSMRVAVGVHAVRSCARRARRRALRRDGAGATVRRRRARAGRRIDAARRRRSASRISGVPSAIASSAGPQRPASACPWPAARIATCEVGPPRAVQMPASARAIERDQLRGQQLVGEHDRASGSCEASPALRRASARSTCDSRSSRSSARSAQPRIVQVARAHPRSRGWRCARR